VLNHYLKDIARHPLLTRDEEMELSRRCREGDEEACERLVSSNLRFVVAIAKRYQGSGVPLADLVNEGNLGLIRAAQRFDGDRGVRFTSYAIWWIRQAISQAIERGRPIRGSKDGRYVSFDQPIADAADLCLQEVVADSQLEPADEQVNRHELKDALESSLSCLPEREQRVLRRYFGLDGEPPSTLDQIGTELGVSRERVRQIKDRGLSRLRAGVRRRALETFHS
jgi:RNA polymerase primary sigma factor